jgi:hypothetical protein
MASHQNHRRQGSGGRGVASPRPPPRATTRQPGAEPDNTRGGSVEGCPRAGARSGYARPTGRHTAPACKIDTRAVAGPSNIEKYRETRRSTESVPSGQPHRVRLLTQVAKRGADELTDKPDSARTNRRPGLMAVTPLGYSIIARSVHTLDGIEFVLYATAAGWPGATWELAGPAAGIAGMCKGWPLTR